MAEIQFQEEEQLRAAYQQPVQESWMVRLIIRLGLARDRAGADKVLIGVAVLAVLISIGIWVVPGGGAGGTPPSPAATLPPGM